jgi:predicted nucleic acid-binding protein
VPFVVVYDANVLYPNTLRDLLVRIAQSGLVQAKWTDRILDEVDDALRANRPDIPEAKLARRRTLMMEAVADCLVTGYESLIPVLTLPDEDDRHVLAAAIRAKAQVLVTDNVSDFPPDYLAGWDIEPKTADEFLVDQVHLNRQVVYGAVQRIADSRQHSPETVEDVLLQLERNGIQQAVAIMRS